MKRLRRNVNDSAIAWNLAALSQCLTEAADLAQKASKAMSDGKRNLAIGTIVDLNRNLAQAHALYTVSIELHRSQPVSKKGGVA
jgi:hypothetical protein